MRHVFLLFTFLALILVPGCRRTAYSPDDSGWYVEPWATSDLNAVTTWADPTSPTDVVHTGYVTETYHIPPTDQDRDGWDQDDDCDDRNRWVNPGAVESSGARCFNLVDDDCDHLTDAEDPDCEPFIDRDGDGFSPSDGDCDDLNHTVHPYAPVWCHYVVDMNCDNIVDQNDPTCVWPDFDGDGVTLQEDCDENDPLVSPIAEEHCDNQEDDDCDGAADYWDANCDPLLVASVSERVDSDTAVVSQSDVPFLALRFCNQTPSHSATVRQLTFHLVGDTDGELAVTHHTLPRLNERVAGCWIPTDAGEPYATFPVVNQQVTIDTRLYVRHGTCHEWMLRCDLTDTPGLDNVLAFNVPFEEELVLENEDGDRVTGNALHLGGPSDPGLNHDFQTVVWLVH